MLIKYPNMYTNTYLPKEMMLVPSLAPVTLKVNLLWK